MNKQTDPRLNPSGAGKGAAYRQGIITFVILAALTGAEFGIAVAMPGLAIVLVAIALVKAGLVLYFFMHIMRVMREEGGH